MNEKSNKGGDTVAATDNVFAPALQNQFCLCSDEGAMTAHSCSHSTVEPV